LHKYRVADSASDAEDERGFRRTSASEHISSSPGENMPKPAKPATKKPAAKVNSIEALKAKAKELERQAEAADDSLREAQHREMKRQTPKQVKDEKAHEEFYQKHKKAIDKELEACTSHLRKYEDTDVPMEIIRRLHDYYWLYRR